MRASPCVRRQAGEPGDAGRGRRRPSATMASVSSPPVVGRRRRGAAPRALLAAPRWGRRGRRPSPARRERDGRRRLVGVRRADPAHDLAALVGLERLEGQRVAGLALRARRATGRSPGTGRGAIASRCRSAVHVTRATWSETSRPSTSIGVVEPLARDLRRPAGDRLVRRGDDAGRQLDVDLDRARVVALVRHADVEPREAARGRGGGLDGDVGPGRGRRARGRRAAAAAAAIGVRMVFLHSIGTVNVVR